WEADTLTVGPQMPISAITGLSGDRADNFVGCVFKFKPLLNGKVVKVLDALCGDFVAVAPLYTDRSICLFEVISNESFYFYFFSETSGTIVSLSTLYHKENKHVEVLVLHSKTEREINEGNVLLLMMLFVQELTGGFQTGSPRGDPAYAETKKNLRKTSKFFVTIKAMMEENESLPDMEKLEHQEFNLDVEEQQRLQLEGKHEVTRVRKEIEMEILAKCYKRETLKKDSMWVGKGKAIKINVEKYLTTEQKEKEERLREEDKRPSLQAKNLDRNEKKLLTSIKEVTQMFDEKLTKLFERKMKSEMVIYQNEIGEELKNTRRLLMSLERSMITQSLRTK
ncbi:hypothetical protein cypCar_00003623, partial [Cyprinus carpio]